MLYWIACFLIVTCGLAIVAFGPFAAPSMWILCVLGLAFSGLIVVAAIQALLVRTRRVREGPHGEHNGIDDIKHGRKWQDER
jgi:hypothetical protein